jgi:hypothetical protein
MDYITLKKHIWEMEHNPHGWISSMFDIEPSINGWILFNLLHWWSIKSPKRRALLLQSIMVATTLDMGSIKWLYNLEFFLKPQAISWSWEQNLSWSMNKWKTFSYVCWTVHHESCINFVTLPCVTYSCNWLDLLLRMWIISKGMFAPSVKSGISKNIRNKLRYTFGLDLFC